MLTRRQTLQMQSGKDAPSLWLKKQSCGNWSLPNVSRQDNHPALVRRSVLSEEVRWGLSSLPLTDFRDGLPQATEPHCSGKAWRPETGRKCRPWISTVKAECRKDFAGEVGWWQGCLEHRCQSSGFGVASSKDITLYQKHWIYFCLPWAQKKT